MNTRPLLLVGLVTSSLLIAEVCAQSQPKLHKLKEQKLAESWVQDSDWVLGYAEAKAAAKETGKPIFAYFSRSYAP